MFSNHPENWHECKSEIEKMRFSLNAFTRMRYLNSSGKLNFSEKGPIDKVRDNLIPWFRHEKEFKQNLKLSLVTGQA